MLGLSYAEIFLILGATAALIGPKDLPIIARTAGRLAGRAIGYVQLARGQFENVMQQTQFRQVNKELQDTMAQLEAIRHEVRSFSIMNPGPMTRRLMDDPEHSNTDPGAPTGTGPSTPIMESSVASAQLPQYQRSQLSEYHLNTETSVFKEHASIAQGASSLYAQATTYSKLAESHILKPGTVDGIASMDSINDRPGLLCVLPVSAESAGLLPKRHGEITGSDIVLEAVLESEVAHNAKEFFSQPQN